MPTEKFVTEDMTLVTVLLMEGIHHTEMKNQNGGCRWVYEGAAVVQKIMAKLQEYNDDSCFVEVRDFTRRQGAVRKEMYQFIGYNPPRVHAKN